MYFGNFKFKEYSLTDQIFIAYLNFKEILNLLNFNYLWNFKIMLKLFYLWILLFSYQETGLIFIILILIWI